MRKLPFYQSCYDKDLNISTSDSYRANQDSSAFFKQMIPDITVHRAMKQQIHPQQSPYREKKHTLLFRDMYAPLPGIHCFHSCFKEMHSLVDRFKIM